MIRRPENMPPIPPHPNMPPPVPPNKHKQRSCILKSECREICVWARACDLPGGKNICPEQCERAIMLKNFWKTPDAMNEEHDYLEMKRKVEE